MYMVTRFKMLSLFFMLLLLLLLLLLLSLLLSSSSSSSSSLWLFIYLLTYSMEQSPSWDAKRFQLVKKFPTLYGTRKFITSVVVIIIIIIIVVVIWYGCLLSQAFSSWYFSWTIGDPNRSGFKLHTEVLSVLCVMFQV